MTAQVEFYKKYRSILQYGSFTRLVSPYEGNGNQIAWQFISQDGNTVIVMYFRELVRAHEKLHRLTLRGLEPGARYQICEYLYPLSEKNKISQSQNLLDYKGCEYSASQLMHVGLYLNKLDMDFTATAWY